MDRQDLKRRKTRRERLKRKRQIKRRFRVFLFLTIGALFFIGCCRVIIIKANNGLAYEQAAIENQINKVTDEIINPNRGTILDRNNQAIAISSTVYNVVLDLRNIFLESDETKQKLMELLSEQLDMDYTTLMAYIEPDEQGNLKEENDTHWKIIKKKISFEDGKALEKLLEEEKINGVYLEEDSQREYPHKNLAAQLIGFIMGDTMWGLESYYNSEMTGTPGRIYRTYEEDNSVVTRDIEPIKGNDIVTTIDLTIQEFAETIVEETYKEASPDYTPESVSLTVINPKTGEIIAMAQYPNFDLNNPLDFSLLEDASYAQNFESLTEDEQMEIRNSIWKNFTITDTYEPGSTFKAMLVAAALEEGVITLDDTFYCEGYRIIAGERVRCHERSGHGEITVREALAQSCNLAMIDIANKLGKEKFYQYQKDFGFGEKTGIDLYGEADASSLIYSLESLNTLELATSAFGQGFNSTSIQTLMAFASVINGGNLLKPYIVSQIVDNEGKVVKENSPQIVRKVITEETSDLLREAMILTVTEGTAKAASIPGYNIAGKTGTAQQGVRDDGEYTLSFIAYFPAEDPEYLALAVIHKPQNYVEGSVSAVPMIKELFLNIIDYKSIPPSNPTAVSNEVSTESDSIVLEDYSNKSLKETIASLNSLGLSYQIVGSGGDTVTKHFPAANTQISKKGEVLLYAETRDENTELQVVPDTEGLTLEEATSILEKVGFEVIYEEITELEESTEEETEDTETTKTVFEQMPQAGVYIEKGTTIKLKIK